jgi:hypothetical protein
MDEYEAWRASLPTAAAAANDALPSWQLLTTQLITEHTKYDQDASGDISPWELTNWLCDHVSLSAKATLPVTFWSCPTAPPLSVWYRYVSFPIYRSIDCNLI